MLKWIFIGILTLIVLAIGTCWVGYKRITAGGSTAVVTLATTPATAWTYLSEPDSMTAWQGPAVSVWMANDSSGLAVGDSLILGDAASPETSGPNSKMRFSLVRLEPGRVIEWIAADDSTGISIVRRTDSLSQRGDSVDIIVAFSTPVIDSIRNNDSIGGFSAKLLGGTSSIVNAAMRMSMQAQLDTLGARHHNR